MIRDAAPSDFPAILALNEALVRYLSPLTPEQLEELHTVASLHRVAVHGDELLGFLLALREGTAYDSPNYRWFCGRYDRFLYIDRVVVAEQHQGAGTGSALYGDALAAAQRAHVPVLAAEYDIDPPNEASRAFHGRLGFREVGRQPVAGGAKRVSLQARAVEPAADAHAVGQGPPDPMVLHPVGRIRTPFATKDDCPVQPSAAGDAAGRVEVFAEYAEGLTDVETFSHLYLLYHLHQAGDVELVRPTFLDDRPHGVFASRHPCRPNGIGLSVVRLVRRETDVLHVAGVDMLDGTPLLDIKPYVPRFDTVDGASNGWVEGLPLRAKPPRRE